MKIDNLTQEEAKILLEAEMLSFKNEKKDHTTFFAKLLNDGLPEEITFRLKSLLDYTITIGTKCIEVGKIIIGNIVDFIKSFPHFSIRVCISAVLYVFVSSIPIIGFLVLPILKLLGIFFVGMGLTEDFVMKAKSIETNPGDAFVDATEAVTNGSNKVYQKSRDFVSKTADIIGKASQLG